MNTSVNNISFKANINALAKTKYKISFEDVCKAFEKGTTKYPNDTLYITKNKSGAYSWHISNKQRGDYFKGEEIFTNSIDNHIEELGVKSFAKELINAFKAMKLERDIYKKAKPVKIELDKTKGLYEAYKKMAEAYKGDGNLSMAKRYEYLANRNQSKLSDLTAQYNKYVNTFKTKLKELSKDYPEIGQVELYLA